MPFYFETSAINYISDFLDTQAIVALKEGLLLLNRGPICVSPISIWEIMSTPDSERRDKLIYTCQLLFDDISIFPSPINVMDHFISEGCPIEESGSEFFKYNTTFSVVWKDVATNLSKTLILSDETNSEDKLLMSRLSKLLRSLIKNDYQLIDNHPDDYYNWICQTITEIYNQIPFIREDATSGQISPQLSLLYKTAIFFAISLLIIGIDLDNQSQVNCGRKRRMLQGYTCSILLFYLVYQGILLRIRYALVYHRSATAADIEPKPVSQ